MKMDCNLEDTNRFDLMQHCHLNLLFFFVTFLIHKRYGCSLCLHNLFWLKQMEFCCGCPSFLHMMTPVDTCTSRLDVTYVLSAAIHIESTLSKKITLKAYKLQNSQKIQPNSFTPFQEIIILSEKLRVCATVLSLVKIWRGKEELFRIVYFSITPTFVFALVIIIFGHYYIVSDIHL